MSTLPNLIEEKTEEVLVKHLVDRFLGWHLPKDFHPDGGIMFRDVYDNGTAEGGKFEPVGTNLFTAEQAKEMFRFLLEHEDGTSALTTSMSLAYEEGRKVEREIAGEFMTPEDGAAYLKALEPDVTNLNR
jgi:hypothetical protein